MNASWNEPFERFAALYRQAGLVQPQDPNAFTLATVDALGRPSARVVLLKDFDERGFAFYTNLESRKGLELRVNPFVALCFHWPALQQQVRIEGAAVGVTPTEADAYFATRPRDSQLGAWASRQSQPLPSRAALEARLEEARLSYEAREVPRPPHWSGLRVAPDLIEFWTAHPHRLHWRERYRRQDDAWAKETLYP
jgi:pyridoxamine 5'-phosphate oxidase